MRKLAREAVIFTLLAMTCVGVAVFIIASVNPQWWSNGVKEGFSETVIASVSAAGFFGAPAGLGLWVLYRLIRFAVKG